ncbi:hypothetical protein ACFW9U_15075 [Rhodococcus aetherivorans]|uniref:hypothetical protein n=1 Tax=Rhodococcus aetherivorans TaxID=191292 RepID=UPI0029491993|nr:hypothetical protein [Rhodococcus aetherivorans]MDV6293816.1 hypothetical protein [Rhodococcus aetherivorans]
MPPQRRKPNPMGPPRGRRPKIAGTGRTPAPGGAARPETPEPATTESATTESATTESATTESATTESATTGPAVTGPATTGPATTATTAPQAPTPAPVEPAGKAPTASGSETARKSAPGLRTPAPVEDAGAEREPGEQPGGTVARGSWRPVAILGGAAVALGAFAAVAAARPGATVSNEAWVDSAATAEVTAAAGHAIETMHGYNHETIEQDFAEIREVLTPPMREEFDLTAEVTKQAAVQTHTATEVRIDHIGASMLDDDRAEVAAFISVSATGDAVAQGSASAPLLVRMERIDGKWLVSEIRDR